MKEQQIDWVEEEHKEFNKSLYYVSSIFEFEDEYKDSYLLVNALRTPDGNILESRHRHDYKSYTDTTNGVEYFVDGGLDYSRGTYTLQGAKDLRIYDTDDITLIRNVFSWGTYGKNMDRDLEYILLKNMSDIHINAVLKTHIPTCMFNMFIQELEYRADNNIIVEDTYGD
jgi:hypothetical protein